MTLSQKWKPIVRHTREYMLCNREKIGLLQGNGNSLQDGSKYPVPRGDGDLFFFDALPVVVVDSGSSGQRILSFLLSVALQLLR